MLYVLMSVRSFAGSGYNYPTSFLASSLFVEVSTVRCVYRDTLTEACSSILMLLTEKIFPWSSGVSFIASKCLHQVFGNSLVRQ